MAGGGAVRKDRGCAAGAPLCGFPGTLVLPIPSFNLSKWAMFWITSILQPDLRQDCLPAMQMVQLQQKIGTTEDRILFLETSEQRLKDCVSQLERSLEVMLASPHSPA